MDAEKVFSEETFAPSSTASFILREDTELRRLPIVKSCAEFPSSQPEHSHVSAHHHDRPAELKENLNPAVKEVPDVTEETYSSSLIGDLEEECLKSSSKDLSTATDDSCMPPISAKLEESLKFTSKDVLAAAEESSKPPFSSEMEKPLNEKVKGLPMVAPSSDKSATAPELEQNFKHNLKDKSVVNFLTDDMIKVSIQHALSNNKDLLHEESAGNGFENGKNSQSHSGCDLIFAGEGVHASVEKMYDKPPCSNDRVEGDDITSQQERDCKMQAETFKDNGLICVIKDCHKLDSHKDLKGGHDVDVNKDDDSVDDDGDGDDNDGAGDNDILVVEDFEEKHESQDSDSSSSTSTLSFSSSSDEDEVDHFRLSKTVNFQKDLIIEVDSECEEGELKESPSQRKKISSKQMGMDMSSEDEGGLKEPLQLTNEMKNLPHVPKVSVTLQPHHTMVPVGFISSLVGVNLIVEGIEGKQPLSEGSILWLTEQRSPLGLVDELFGPVKKPFYVVRYNDTTELPGGAREGAQVSYVRDFADFILNNPDLYAKGYDKSGDNNEEVSDSEVEFSDDEKEAEYKRLKSRAKRGISELRTSDIDIRQHQEKKTQGKCFIGDSRNQRLRGDDVRNGFSGRAPRQNPRPQHRRGERDPTFQCHQGGQESPFQHSRMEPMDTSSEREFEKRSPVHQVRSHQSRGMGRSNSLKPPRHAVSMSDEVNLFKQRAVVSKTDHRQASPGPGTHKEVQPTQSNQSSQSTSWEPQSAQGNQSGGFMQPGAPPQSTLQKMQINQSQIVMQSNFEQGQLNQAHMPVQSTSQLVQVNQSHSFMQPAPQQVLLQFNQPLNLLPSGSQQGQMINQSQLFMQTSAQVNQPFNFTQPMLSHPQQWSTNQPPVSLQRALHPEGLHSQIPTYNGAVVVGQVPQIAGNGYGIPTTNNAPFQSGMGQGQGALPMNQATIFQQVPSSNQLSSFGPHQYSAQVPGNMGLPTANQIQVAHVDGYPIGAQTGDFSNPVVGVPAGPAGVSSSYSIQVMHNQQYPGFNPGSAPPVGNQGLPSTFGMPDRSQHMQPSPGTSAGSWQGQHTPQGSCWQQPYQQRPHYGQAPHRRYRS